MRVDGLRYGRNRRWIKLAGRDDPLFRPAQQPQQNVLPRSARKRAFHGCGVAEPGALRQGGDAGLDICQFDRKTTATVWVYDPARDVWMQGPPVPIGRRRGSTGLVVHDDTFYVIAGNTIGHNGGYVAWLDAFDPLTGEWTVLTDAPGARDHLAGAGVSRCRLPTRR